MRQSGQAGSRRRIRLLGRLALGLCLAQAAQAAQSYYVDPGKGSDGDAGTLARPFATLRKALATVDARARQGIRSDKIYLRGGVYREQSSTTLYHLNLRGAANDFAVLSAMPAKAHAPGAVMRKSGQWFEKVVIDDAFVIRTPWERVPGKPRIWQTRPGYTKLEWTHQNLWPWARYDYVKITDRDSTPETTSFTVAPYLLLQDNESLLWADSLKDLAPGARTYDHDAGILYVWPAGDRDPNTCKFESWYGGPEKSEGLLLLDGEGRAMFDGNLEYASIRGIEFRMFTRLFEFHRQKYDRESDRIIQRHVRFEDNLCRYGWVHMLLDSNTVYQKEEKVILPRYKDRSDWLVRNNVFFRPSREVFQVHGENHVFEHNEIVEHCGPWVGPAGIVSAVNTRNMGNAMIRHNAILGHGNPKWPRGSVFMIEVAGGHKDANGDCLYGGQTYLNNLIVNVAAGPAMALGKGGCRLKNVTVRGNVIAGNPGGQAIRLISPHTNLKIESNLFYDQNAAIDVSIPKAFREAPSTIAVRDNIFARNRKTIHPELLSPGEGSAITLEGNLFHQNEAAPAGGQSLEGDPLFRDPARFDFGLRPGSPAVRKGKYAGPYGADGSVLGPTYRLGGIPE